MAASAAEDSGAMAGRGVLPADDPWADEVRTMGDARRAEESTSVGRATRGEPDMVSAVGAEFVCEGKAVNRSQFGPA